MYLDRPRQVGPPADSSHSSVPVAHVASLDFFRLALCRFFFGGGGSRKTYITTGEKDGTRFRRHGRRTRPIFSSISSIRGGEEMISQIKTDFLLRSPEIKSNCKRGPEGDGRDDIQNRRGKKNKSRCLPETSVMQNKLQKTSTCAICFIFRFVRFQLWSFFLAAVLFPSHT